MKNGLEAMLADQRFTAEKYKANFSLLEAQHIKLQSETQHLKDDVVQKESDLHHCGKRFEGQLAKLEGERDRLLLEIEGLKTKIMTPAKLENLRQNLLKDVEMIYKQHLSQTEDEVEAYRKELNKLKYDHSFLKTEYENCQNEYAQRLEDLHAKFKLDIDSSHRKCESLKKTLDQKNIAAQESVSLMKENTKMSAKIKSLIAENESIRKQIGEECRKSDEKVAKVSMQLSEFHVKHEIVNNENRSMATRIEKLQDKLEQSNEEMTKQIPLIATLEDQVMKLTSEIEDLNQKQKMELAMAENGFKRQLSEARKESDNIEAKMSDSRTQADFLAKTIEELKASLRSKEKEFTEKLQTLKDDHWDSVNRANQEKLTVENKLTASEKQHLDKLHSLQVELEKAKSQNEVLTSSIEASAREKDDWAVKMDKLQSTVDSKDKDLSSYQKIELEIQSLQAQLKSTTNQYKEQSVENDKLKNHNKLANTDITDLRQQIKEMKLEFENICHSNKSSWEKENAAIKEKYQELKKRVGKGDKRRETILNLAKKQKNQHHKEMTSLKDTVICCQAREKQYELEKESQRKNHELEIIKLRRQIDKFKVKATEFEGLLYNPMVGDSTMNGSALPMPEAFTSILAGTKEQQHELEEISKNLNDFQEKQADLEKVV